MFFQGILSVFSGNKQTDESDTQDSWLDFFKFMLGVEANDDEMRISSSSSTVSTNEGSDVTSFSRVMASFIASDGSPVSSDNEGQVPSRKTYRSSD